MSVFTARAAVAFGKRGIPRPTHAHQAKSKAWWLLALCACLFAGRAFASGQVGDTAAAVADAAACGPVSCAEVTYEFAVCRSERPCVDIRLMFGTQKQPYSVLSLAEGWGGVIEAGASITSITAIGADGKPREVSYDGRDRTWRVSHRPGEVLDIQYRFSPPAMAESDSIRFHRGLVDDRRVHLFAATSLLFSHDWALDEVRRVHLRWKGYQQDGWTVAASVGNEDVLELSKLRNAAFLAYKNASSLKVSLADGSRVDIVADEGLASSLEAIAPRLKLLLERQKALFPHIAYPDRVLISALTLGDGNSLEGNGIENGLSLAIGKSYDLRHVSHLLWLVGHELLHLVLRPDVAWAADEKQIYWYSEGFTNFINRSVLLDAGLISLDEYVSDINRVLGALASSSLRNLPNATIAGDFWNNAEARNMPYLRGDIAALLIDDRMRTTGGRVWAMAEEWQLQARAGNRMSEEEMFAEISSRLGVEASPAVVGFLKDGRNLRLPKTLMSPCLRVRQVPTYRYDLGFDLQATQRNGVIVGVKPKSAAAKAGLRDGLAPSAMGSSRANDVTSEVKIVVKTDEGDREIRYLPRSRDGSDHQVFSVRDRKACPGTP